MTHTDYVYLAYGVTAFAIVAVSLWILNDQRVQKNKLALLEQAGIVRRSGGKQ